MFALNRAERRAVSAAAVGTFAVACALVPGQAGGRLAPPGIPPASPEAKARTLPPDVLPARDPFVPRIAEPDGDPRPATPLRIAPLPANAGAGRFPFAGVASVLPHLLAVVRGPAPGALLEDHGTARFVTLGDRVAGSRVTAINDDGLLLDDGRRLALANAHPEGFP